MDSFAEEVTSVNSLLVEERLVDFWRSERDISSTGHEDVAVLCCDEGEHVALQRPDGDETFYIYAAVLEEVGVQLPLNTFEADVLKFNVAPLQIRPNSWAFICGFEILCKALGLEPSLGPFLYFYGTKDVNKGTWISISVLTLVKNSFCPMRLISRKTGKTLLLR